MSSNSTPVVQSGEDSSSGDESHETADRADLRTKKQDKEKRPKDVCGHCNKKCTSTGKFSHAFECDYCHYWVHAECEGYTEDKYRKFVEVSQLIDNMNYYCKFSNCQKVNTDVVKSIGATATKVEENKQKIAALEYKYDTKFQEIDQKIVDEVKANTESLIQDKVKSAWDLERERAERQNCIIISKLPEPDQTLSYQERDSKDRDEVNKIFKDYMELSDTDFLVQSTFRLGKNPNRDGTPRMLKVTLDRLYMVRTVLGAVKKIRSVTNPTIKNLNIFKDMPKEDREARQILVKDMKARNEQLKRNPDPNTGEPVTDRWTIRNDKLIFVDKDGNEKRNF